MSSSKRSSKAIGTCFMVVLMFGLVWAATGCSPRTSSKTPDENQPQDLVVDMTWSPDGNCGACHEREESGRSISTLLASYHAATECTECHEDTATYSLADVHKNVTGPDTTVSSMQLTLGKDKMCLKCHGSYEELATKSDVAGVVLVDEKGNEVNPHAIPETTRHADVAKQCYNCHGIHEVSSDPTDSCYGCHHKKVFECYTCHG